MSVGRGLSNLNVSHAPAPKYLETSLVLDRTINPSSTQSENISESSRVRDDNPEGNYETLVDLGEDLTIYSPEFLEKKENQRLIIAEQIEKEINNDELPLPYFDTKSEYFDDSIEQGPDTKSIYVINKARAQKVRETLTYTQKALRLKASFSLRRMGCKKPEEFLTVLENTGFLIRRRNGKTSFDYDIPSIPFIKAILKETNEPSKSILRYGQLSNMQGLTFHTDSDTIKELLKLGDIPDEDFDRRIFQINKYFFLRNETPTEGVLNLEGISDILHGRREIDDELIQKYNLAENISSKTQVKLPLASVDKREISELEVANILATKDPNSKGWMTTVDFFHDNNLIRELNTYLRINLSEPLFGIEQLRSIATLEESEQKDILNEIKFMSDFFNDEEKRKWLSIYSHPFKLKTAEKSKISREKIINADKTYNYKPIIDCMFLRTVNYPNPFKREEIKSNLFRFLLSGDNFNEEDRELYKNFEPDQSFYSFSKVMMDLQDLHFSDNIDDLINTSGFSKEVSQIIRHYQKVGDDDQIDMVIDLNLLNAIPKKLDDSRENNQMISYEAKSKISNMIFNLGLNKEERKSLLSILPSSVEESLVFRDQETAIFEYAKLPFDTFAYLIDGTESSEELVTKIYNIDILRSKHTLLKQRITDLNLIGFSETYGNISVNMDQNLRLSSLVWLAELSDDNYETLLEKFKSNDYKYHSELICEFLLNENKEELEIVVTGLNKLYLGEKTDFYVNLDSFDNEYPDILKMLKIADNGNLEDILPIAQEMIADGYEPSLAVLSSLSDVATNEGFNPTSYSEELKKVISALTVENQKSLHNFDNENYEQIYLISRLNKEEKQELYDVISTVQKMGKTVLLSDYWNLFNHKNRKPIITLFENLDSERFDIHPHRIFGNESLYTENTVNSVLAFQALPLPQFTNSQISLNQIVDLVTYNSFSIKEWSNANALLLHEFPEGFQNSDFGKYTEVISFINKDLNGFNTYSIPFIKEALASGIKFGAFVDPTTISALSPENKTYLIFTMKMLDERRIPISVNDYRPILNAIGKHPLNKSSLQLLGNTLRVGDIASAYELGTYLDKVFPANTEEFHLFVKVMKLHGEPSLTRIPEEKYRLFSTPNFNLCVDFFDKNGSLLPEDYRIDKQSARVLITLLTNKVPEDRLTELIRTTINSYPLSNYLDLSQMSENLSGDGLATIIELTSKNLYPVYGKNGVIVLSKVIPTILNAEDITDRSDSILLITKIINTLKKTDINPLLLTQDYNLFNRLLKDAGSNYSGILRLSSGSSGLIAVTILDDLVAEGVIDLSNSKDILTYERFVNDIGFFPAKLIFQIYKHYDQELGNDIGLLSLQFPQDLVDITTKKKFTERINAIRQQIIMSGNINPTSLLEREVMMIESRFENGRFKRGTSIEGYSDIIERFYSAMSRGEIKPLPEYYKEDEITVEVIGEFKLSKDAIENVSTLLDSSDKALTMTRFDYRNLSPVIFDEINKQVLKEQELLAERGSSIGNALSNEQKLIQENLSLLKEMISNPSMNISHVLETFGVNPKEAKILAFLLRNPNSNYEIIYQESNIDTERSAFNGIIKKLKSNKLLVESDTNIFETDLNLLSSYALSKTRRKYDSMGINLENSRTFYIDFQKKMSDLNTLISTKTDPREIAEAIGLEITSSITEIDSNFVVNCYLHIISSYQDEALSKKISLQQINPIVNRLLMLYVYNNPHILNLSHDLGEEMTQLRESQVGLRHINTLTEFVNEYIGNHALKELDLTEKQKKSLLNTFNMKPLLQDLQNFNNSSSYEEKTLRLYPTRGILGEFTGDLGDVCTVMEKDVMRNYPEMVAVTIVEEHGQSMQSNGSILVIRNSINGVPAIVLRALNPRQDIFDSGVTGDSFLKQSIKFLERIADRMALEEGLEKVIIVAPGADSGAFSNRVSLIQSHPNYFNKTTHSLDTPIIFNGHDITHDIYVLKDRSEIMPDNSGAKQNDD